MASPYQFDSFEQQRQQMVSAQLVARGIRDPRVLEAMRSVPRHEFVLEEFRGQAYDDRPLPAGEGQTISQPYIVAVMLEHLELQPSDRVLEIGTGSGYATALLTTLCAEVFSVERHASLASLAGVRLARLGYNNVKIQVGNGRLGWPEHAPFDAVLVSAATAEIPPHLFEQLREGGRMILPVGPPSAQELQLIRKVNGTAEAKGLEGCRFVPLVAEP
jgi:protein-L-isoaspartate(D-aspartate) O-methyltransferase